MLHIPQAEGKRNGRRAESFYLRPEIRQIQLPGGYRPPLLLRRVRHANPYRDLILIVSARRPSGSRGDVNRRAPVNREVPGEVAEGRSPRTNPRHASRASRPGAHHRRRPRDDGSPAPPCGRLRHRPSAAAQQRLFAVHRPRSTSIKVSGASPRFFLRTCRAASILSLSAGASPAAIRAETASAAAPFQSPG